MAGVGNWVYNLVNFLINKDIDLVLICLQGKKLPKLNPKIKIIKIDSDYKVGLKRYRSEKNEIPQIINKEKPDLYHATDSLGISCGIDAPTVLTLHDLIPLELGEYLNYFTKVLYKKSLRESINNADYIITISHYTQKCLENFFDIRDNVSVIYNGYDKPKVGDNFEKLSKKFGIDKNYVIYVGGLGPRKNILKMIEAFSKIKKEKNLQFIIVGDKKPTIEREWRAYENKINNLGLEKEIILTGFLDDQDMNTLRKKAKIALYVSTYEGFGLPILETFYLGVPMVTSNVTAMPEIANNAALTVDPKNVDQITKAIKKIITDNNLRNDLIKRGKKRSEEFSWEKMGQKYLDLYKKISEEKNA